MTKNYTQRLKARIEPQLHLRVPYESGGYNEPKWSNKDLDPVPPEKRTWGSLDYCKSHFLTRRRPLSADNARVLLDK